jgi:hypothetical protein
MYIVLYTCTLHTRICNQYTKVLCTTNLHTMYVELCTKHIHVERHTQKHCLHDVALHIFAHTSLTSGSTLQVSVYMGPQVLGMLHEIDMYKLCKYTLRTHPLCSGEHSVCCHEQHFINHHLTIVPYVAPIPSVHGPSGWAQYAHTILERLQNSPTDMAWEQER